MHTIRGRFSTLAFASKVMGFKEYTWDFRIRKLLRGWACKMGPIKDDRYPISPDLLGGLWGTWPAICSSQFKIALLHVASLVAFFGALRVSELEAKKDTSDRALRLQDVEHELLLGVLQLIGIKRVHW